MDWKTFKKNTVQKIEKNSKNQVEIATCEQKTTSEKANFCSNTFSQSTLKLERKKFHTARPLAFSFYFLFQCDHSHYSNLTSFCINRLWRRKINHHLEVFRG